MNTDAAGPVNLSALRRLLGESDRDVAALSREEADRIVAIPDLDRRLRAYMGLREVWAYGGDRLLPEDDARIQASFADSGVAAALAPPPNAPPAALPLTPVTLLGWAERWRAALVASAIQRGAAAGGPRDEYELEALASAMAEAPQTYLPELTLLRQLDTLTTELREGLEARQLLPGEALPGDTRNLPGLLKVAASARARREIPVPGVPPLPGQRCTVQALLGWLEALLVFEESVGARAILQAGMVSEPGEARARFLAAARGGAPDVGGHAAAQIGSWRRAEGVHRAVDVALAGQWLARERVVALPSFEVRELETFFLAFAGGVPSLLPPGPVTTPDEVAQWWTQRRAMALRSLALTLLADGALQGTANLEARAEELAVRGLVQALPQLSELAQADQVLAACRAVLALDMPVGTVQDGTDAMAVLRAWGAYAARPAAPPAPAVPAPQAPAPVAAPAPAPAAAPPTVEAPVPGVASPGLFPVSVSVAARARLPTAAPPRQAAVSAAAPAVEAAASPPAEVAALPEATPSAVRASSWAAGWAGLRETMERGMRRAWLPLLAVAGVGVFQGGALLLAALDGGASYRSELALRLARLGDPLWVAQGGVLLGAFLLVAAGLRGGLRAPWGAARWVRLGLAGAVLVGAQFMPASPRFFVSAEGFAAWPERVVVRGGVPTATLVPAEGFWLRGVVVEPMAADDVVAPEAGAPALALLREVGPLGRPVRWLVANRSDVEALMGRPIGQARVAPAASLRREIAR